MVGLCGAVGGCPFRGRETVPTLAGLILPQVSVNEKVPRKVCPGQKKARTGRKAGETPTISIERGGRASSGVERSG